MAGLFIAPAQTTVKDRRPLITPKSGGGNNGMVRNQGDRFTSPYKLWITRNLKGIMRIEAISGNQPSQDMIKEMSLCTEVHVFSFSAVP